MELPVMKKVMKTISLFLCVMIFATSLPVFFAETESASAATATMVNENVRGKVLYSYSYKVLTLINKERKKKKLSQLKMTQGLLSVANRRAAEISLYYAHSRPNGEKNPFKMYKWKHYVGENIALNQQTPEQVVKCWMNSPPHKKNILNKKFNSVGIGCFKVNGYIYWEQFFVDNKASRNAAQKSNGDVTYTVSMKTSNVKLRSSVKSVWFDDFYTRRITTYQFNKRVDNYDFVTNLDNSCIQYKSANENIAKINSKGVVLPVANGKTTITANLKGYPSKKVTWTVIVDVEEM